MALIIIFRSFITYARLPCLLTTTVPILITFPLLSARIMPDAFPDFTTGFGMGLFYQRRIAVNYHLYQRLYFASFHHRPAVAHARRNICRANKT